VSLDSTLRFHVSLDYAGRKLRVELYDDGTGLCTACPAGGCEHIAYARRLRDQPATVALERLRDTYVTDGAVFDDHARMAWAVQAYRLAVEVCEQQTETDRRALYRLWRDTDPRTTKEIADAAAAWFQTPGGPSTPIESEWGQHARTSPADSETAHLGAGSTYDPAIHQEP